MKYSGRFCCKSIDLQMLVLSVNFSGAKEIFLNVFPRKQCRILLEVIEKLIDVPHGSKPKYSYLWRCPLSVPNANPSLFISATA